LSISAAVTTSTRCCYCFPPLLLLMSEHRPGTSGLGLFFGTIAPLATESLRKWRGRSGSSGCQAIPMSTQSPPTPEHRTLSQCQRHLQCAFIYPVEAISGLFIGVFVRDLASLTRRGSKVCDWLGHSGGCSCSLDARVPGPLVAYVTVPSQLDASAHNETAFPRIT